MLPLVEADIPALVRGLRRIGPVSCIPLVPPLKCRMSEVPMYLALACMYVCKTHGRGAMNKYWVAHQSQQRWIMSFVIRIHRRDDVFVQCA